MCSCDNLAAAVAVDDVVHQHHHFQGGKLRVQCDGMQEAEELRAVAAAVEVHLLALEQAVVHLKDVVFVIHVHLDCVTRFFIRKNIKRFMVDWISFV